MSIENFDAIIIGAGQAGPLLAERCSKEGLKTALIERGAFGGTCVNVGCTPTKAMVASARAMHQARRGDEFGFSTGALQVDMARVKARKDALVHASSSGVEQWMRGLEGVEVIVGEARFTGPQTLQVGQRVVTAPRIFLNVGARSLRPPIPGIDDVATLDNVSILELATVPQHLVVVGGSYIGLEFAQMMRRFGAEVTVFEKSSRFLDREDEEVAEGIRTVLEAEGIRIVVGADALALAAQGEQTEVSATVGGTRLSVLGSHVLLAIGRQPNTDALGLDLAGIERDKRGYITVDEQCRTNIEGVWALGDCNGRGAFTHTAYNDHEIVVANLFDKDPRCIADRVPCYALFMDPPLGRIGLSEAQVRASGQAALMATLPMQRVGRAREMSETLGFMKVLVDAHTGQLLGASILGLLAALLPEKLRGKISLALAWIAPIVLLPVLIYSLKFYWRW